ncbi:MAG: BREX-1 system adenine-specific DNA-methyltransferase PglX [Dethiosulfatibacter sp.]|nr:BREX-1 system adenine-specific DNA-methyltransferase PglX [Dethiosulfatibacter sp.]
MNIDPCMGSGHILVYAFEVLMQIYESQGYTQRDAANAIIKNNLFGLDIDTRAYQLAYFSLMMKGRKYDRRFLAKEITPNIYAITESNLLKNVNLQYFGNTLSSIDRNNAVSQVEYLLNCFIDAREYGSILNIDSCNWELLHRFVNDFAIDGQLTLESIETEKSQRFINGLINIARVMEQKYDVVMTNPPYMGNNGMNGKLSSFVKKYYAEAKSDMSTVFMLKALKMCKKHGYITMINIPVWMFLSSYEKLRNNLINQCTFINMVHFGRGVFGSDFGTTSFVLLNSNIQNYLGKYLRLFDKQGAVDSVEKKEQFFFEEKRRKLAKQDDFNKIPGEPIAYWVDASIINAFSIGKPIADLGVPRTGIMTGDNNRFLRLWWEVDYKKSNFIAENVEEAIQSQAKWFPYNKGGTFRKWYGNNDYVINWENAGHEVFNCAKNDRRNSQDYPNEYKFKQAISWSLVTSGQPAFRMKKNNLSDIAGPSLYIYGKDFYYILAFCNSRISLEMLNILNPTINYQAGNIAQLPILNDNEVYDKVINITQKNIAISKDDWDSYEYSWDFKKHPMINGSDISVAFEIWKKNCKTRFEHLKANEKEINNVFVNIYNMKDIIDSDINNNDVSLQKADLNTDIKSFISYAVGCMFGRYSLDEDGLIYAGGHWDANKYNSFIPDKDNCIPITDEKYFEDDIVGRFVEFVKVVYGKETLEKNLDFIANALGGKGNTSREVIRNYFIKDFFKDHVKTYQKRPIYWLYDSGKQNGFKALIYMHRYTADTTGIVRVDYLHKMQKIYMSEIDRMQDMIENSTHARDVAQAEKRKEKLIKQLKETKEYDEKIAHIALSRIDIDLDDGVKVNYDKAQTAQDGKRLDILAKI